MSELHARTRRERRRARHARMSDVSDAAQHPHAARHNAALEPEDDEGAPSPRRPLSLDGGEQPQCALGIDVIEREPGARAAWEVQPTSRRTEVAPDVLDAHAQRHQVEDGDGEPHIPGPCVDAGAPDGLPRVFGGRPERPESGAEHERRNAEQVGGRVAGPERRGARSPREAVDAERQGSSREGRSGREGLVRSLHGEVVDRGERRGVREDDTRVADDGRAGAAHARRPGRAGKRRKHGARRLGGQADRRSGSQQGDEQADDTTARSSNRRRHWIRMTPSRPTSEERSAPPEGSVKRRMNPAAAASCCAR